MNENLNYRKVKGGLIHEVRGIKLGKRENPIDKRENLFTRATNLLSSTFEL